MFTIQRTNDGKTFKTEDFKFVVFHSDGRGKELQEKIEVVKDEPGLIEFNTRNSNYTIKWKK